MNRAYFTDAELDFLSLGALVHRLDPGIVPFRKATECQIHVSGGEFNVAANLSDGFGMRTGVATAMNRMAGPAWTPAAVPVRCSSNSTHPSATCSALSS